MLARNRFGAIRLIAMNDLDIVLDVRLIEQTTTHVEVTADSFRDRVR